MKKILLFIMCLFSVSCFAEPLKGMQQQPYPNCTPASWNPPDANFNAEFEAAAYCNCALKGHLTEDYCKNVLGMHMIYVMTIQKFGSIPGACSPDVQKDVPTDECIGQWNLYCSTHPSTCTM